MPILKYSKRLAASSTQLIDLSRSVDFQFDGKTIEAFEGDTLASALYAAGIRSFSRSFKYHRPRGLLCAAGRCPNCLVTVDGVPNVRACVKQVQPGMQVRHQNAWPSLDHDLLSFLDRLDRLMPVGFYYKSFHRPKLMWRLAQPVIRRVAGLGVLEVNTPPEERYYHRNLHTQVAVVGGGPAGLSAALAAAEAGASVTLIDDQPSLGGSLRFDARRYRDIDRTGEAAGSDIGNRLVQAVKQSADIKVLSNAVAFGLYQDNLLGVLCEDHLVKLRAKEVILATGTYEVPVVFARNDLPGIMLATAAQRLLYLYGVRPGALAVIATSNDQGYFAALDLLEAGARVSAVIDSRAEWPSGMEAAEALKSRGILVLNSHAVRRAEGSRKVSGVIVARLDKGRLTAQERRLDCDLVCMSGGFQPASPLLYQAGAQLRYDDSVGETIPHKLPSGVQAAGELTGIHDLAVSILQGRHAGAAAAGRLGLKPVAGSLGGAELAGVEDEYRKGMRGQAATEVPGHGRKQFVCFCEDVTAGDIADAIGEGFEDIQTLKRYTTVTMGPCQGKMCLKSFAGICAANTGRSIDETGVTTQRPPVQPVPLGALAGPSHMPMMRSPMDRKHRELGASMVELGTWQRAHSYGSPQDECLAVRQRVGMIDVSTLGKLDVRGRDAPALLDKLYTHHFSDLGIGRIRYGLLCSDSGTILDDGTVARLAEDRYFVTTTTGNIALMEEWYKWWLAGTGMCAHVTNLTSGFAAINVAGPRARETLKKLTDLDLSPAAFPYLRSAQAEVAGVSAILLRIGFVGETSWEVHFPAEYGEYMWDVLREAGKEFGMVPFALEAQRILRLEKKHIIVGQDTDAFTNPLESDMGWAVRFDKPDFIGRGGLSGVRERGLRNKLVGFVMQGRQMPEDGNTVVMGRSPVGRVTSARLSPTLGKGFGLAWVPIELAEEEREIKVLVKGKSLPAKVTLQPFYDPEGKRLRE